VRGLAAQMAAEQDADRRGKLQKRLEDEETDAEKSMSGWLEENVKEATSAALPLEHTGIYDMKGTSAKKKELLVTTPKLCKWVKANPYKKRLVS
jgi:hypothetical protein